MRYTKALKLPIIKPADEMPWDDLARLLRDVRYRVYRLANLAISERYLGYHLFRTGQATPFECPKCEYKANADYNAARNLAILDIEERIRVQCKEQRLEYRPLTTEKSEEV